MNPSWKYMDNKRATSAHVVPPTTMISICGRNPESYGISWKGDEEGLKTKTKCRVCVRILG